MKLDKKLEVRAGEKAANHVRVVVGGIEMTQITLQHNDWTDERLTKENYMLVCKAFINAGALARDENFYSFLNYKNVGWDVDNDIYHSISGSMYWKDDRRLTLDQILNATNSGVSFARALADKSMQNHKEAIKMKDYKMDYTNPFFSGRDAFNAGLSIDDNPVDRRTNSNARVNWDHGFLMAKENSCKGPNCRATKTGPVHSVECENEHDSMHIDHMLHSIKKSREELIDAYFETNKNMTIDDFYKNMIGLAYDAGLLELD